MYKFSFHREVSLPKAFKILVETPSTNFRTLTAYKKFEWVKGRFGVACLLEGRKRWPLEQQSSTRYFRKGPPAGRAKFKPRSFFVATTLAVIGTFVYNIYKVKIRYAKLIPPNADLLPLPDSDGYIYICDPFDEVGIWKTQWLRWLPFLQDPSYTVAWRLVQDTESGDSDKRRNAIAILSTMLLEDSQYHQIAQVIGYRTGVALAHSNADPRIVGRSGSVDISHPKGTLGEKFRFILNSMPKESIHPCVIDYSNAAIRQFLPSEVEEDSLAHDTLTGFESEQLFGAKYNKNMREDQFLIPCLQAILSYSRVKENAALLLQLKVIDALILVVEKYRGNREIIQLVVKIIANLTCDPNITLYIQETGCLRLLAELAESLDLNLSMPARRALHNLDREFNTPILPPGIYQLFPDFRFDESQLDMDIVFVHGLLGGAFRTWRRQDKRAVIRVSMKPTGNTKPSKIRAWIDGFTPLSQGKEPEVSNNNAGKNNNYGNNNSEKNKRKEQLQASRVWKDERWVVTEDCFDVEEERQAAGASQCWPRDWLPKDIDNTRILAVDFDSFVTHWTKVCPVENIGRTLFDRSSELLEKLSSAGIGRRPIVWVTHSMGGLLVKNLLSQASSSSKESDRAVVTQTRGIMFCSVPHIGSNVATRTSAGPAVVLMPTQEVKELSYGSKELMALNENFKRLRQDMHYKVVSFGETQAVTFSSLGVKIQLVPLSSADPGYGDFYTLDVDHLNICKVPSRGAFVYRKLVEMVENVRSKTDFYDDGESPDAPILFPVDTKSKKRKIFSTSKAKPSENKKL